MPPSPTVTIKHLAARLGISHATVSRALADSPLVGAETRERVKQAALALGYVVHSSARVMRGGSSAIVGLVVPEFQADFFADLAKSLAAQCVEVQHSLMLCVTQNDARIEEQHIRSLREVRAAGVIVFPTMELSEGSLTLLRAMRTVQIGRQHPLLVDQTSFVGTEDESSMALLTQHLAALGHRRIAFIGSHATMPPGLDRLRGFERGIANAGIALDPALVFTGRPSVDDGHEGIRRLLGRTPAPTAVMATSAPMALGALDHIHQIGLRVPQELSFVGFGDPPWYRLWGAGITTAAMPVPEMARAALAAVLEGAQDPSVGPMTKRFRTEVLLRGTTAPPP